MSVLDELKEVVQLRKHVCIIFPPDSWETWHSILMSQRQLDLWNAYTYGWVEGRGLDSVKLFKNL